MKKCVEPESSKARIGDGKGNAETRADKESELETEMVLRQTSREAPMGATQPLPGAEVQGLLRLFPTLLELPEFPEFLTSFPEH